MTRTELLFNDIIVVDHNVLCHDGRPLGYYVVTMNNEGKKVALNFHGNCNCENRASGWYDLESEFDNELPYGTVAVIRPKWMGCTFRGDFSNEKYYTLVWGEMPKDIPSEW